MISVCKPPNDPALIAEFFTDADLTSLNAALAKEGISPAQIVAIFPHAGATLVYPKPPQFRVLYRPASDV
jgi:hypothetical protein